MAYEVVMSYHLHMPSYFLGTFTEYPYENDFNIFSGTDYMEFTVFINRNHVIRA